MSPRDLYALQREDLEHAHDEIERLNKENDDLRRAARALLNDIAGMNYDACGCCARGTFEEEQVFKNLAALVPAGAA